METALEGTVWETWQQMWGSINLKFREKGVVAVRTEYRCWRTTTTRRILCALWSI